MSFLQIAQTMFEKYKGWDGRISITLPEWMGTVIEVCKAHEVKPNVVALILMYYPDFKEKYVRETLQRTKGNIEHFWFQYETLVYEKEKDQVFTLSMLPAYTSGTVFDDGRTIDEFIETLGYESRSKRAEVREQIESYMLQKMFPVGKHSEILLEMAEEWASYSESADFNDFEDKVFFLNLVYEYYKRLV